MEIKMGSWICHSANPRCHQGWCRAGSWRHHPQFRHCCHSCRQYYAPFSMFFSVCFCLFLLQCFSMFFSMFFDVFSNARSSLFSMFFFNVFSMFFRYFSMFFFQCYHHCFQCFSMFFMFFNAFQCFSLSVPKWFWTLDSGVLWLLSGCFVATSHQFCSCSVATSLAAGLGWVTIVCHVDYFWTAGLSFADLYRVP